MEEVPDHFKNLLQTIATEQGFVNFEVNVAPISSGGANYTSKLFTATVKEGAKELNMFAKVAAMGEKIRSRSPKYYEIEYFFYTNIAKTYEKLQEDHNILDEFKLNLPKFYGSHPKEFEETIVLENLVLDSYVSYDRFKSIDWPYASAAVTELAKMHALSLAHEEYYPEDFKNVIEKLKFEWDPDDPVVKVYGERVIERTIGMVCEENRDKLQRYFEEFKQEENMMFYKPRRRAVLSHGDYRPSNLMHRVLDGGKLDIKVLDLQTLQGTNPITDLMYFIFTGSDEQFRAQYYDKLVEDYYTQLAAAMTRLQLNPEDTYSKQDFYEELKEKLPLGLWIAVFSLPIVTVDTESAPKVDENFDLTSLSVEKTSNLLIERLNGVINDYVRWGTLK